MKDQPGLNRAVNRAEILHGGRITGCFHPSVRSQFGINQRETLLPLRLVEASDHLLDSSSQQSAFRPDPKLYSGSDHTYIIPDER